MRISRARIFICGAVVLTVTAAACWRLVGGEEPAGSTGPIHLVGEYQRNILADLSGDGRLLLSYQTAAPMRSFTINLDGSDAKANQAGMADERLRVIEREGGREVGSISVRFFPLEQQFIPGTQQVFYREPNSEAQPSLLYRRWDVASGQSQTCPGEGEDGFTPAVFLDPDRLLGTVMQKGDGDLLVELNLLDCTRSVLGPVDPENPSGRIWAAPSLSPDNRFLAFPFYGGRQVLIWDITSKKVVRRLKPDPLFFGDKALYTPDGRQLIVVAATDPFAHGAKCYLRFYDANTYQQIRQLDLPAASAEIAVSPDGRLLAIGYTDSHGGAFFGRERASVVLYDFATGQEVGRAWHRPVKPQRNDPFVAKVGRIMFTPDSKFMLSSTYDTLVWRVGS